MQTNSADPASSDDGFVRRFLRATEVDTRTLGMIAALLVIWVGFDVYSGIRSPGGGGLFGGTFLTPRNLWILLVQTSTIGIMTTGMVLVIVLRNIDLSVGSMLSLVAVAGGVLQVFVLGPAIGVGNPVIWIAAVVFIVALGSAIGFGNGLMIAYGQIPSFIVTLGGLIAFGGAAFLIASGVTVAPLDRTFALIGGSGPYASIGPIWSWALGIAAGAAIIAGLAVARRQRLRFKFTPRPMWAEILLGAVGCVVVAGVTAIVNAYLYPPRVAAQFALDNHIPIPLGVENRDGVAICLNAAGKVISCTTGLTFQTGYPIPVLILLTIALVMSFVATRTKFGRYVYATGGNPEAAELAGVNTKRVTVAVFTVMGALVGVSATVASARLNAATTALGTLNELYVIAASVIGGTSLAGGVGTIYGAILGALVMQSLQSGMGLLNVDSAWTNIVVGGVLVLAVFVDQIYRRNVK
jgi:D-xylose transport system permease protein